LRCHEMSRRAKHRQKNGDNPALDPSPQSHCSSDKSDRRENCPSREGRVRSDRLPQCAGYQARQQKCDSAHKIEHSEGGRTQIYRRLIGNRANERFGNLSSVSSFFSV